MKTAWRALMWIKDHFEEVLCGVMFVLMTLIINIEVIRRYVFQSPGAYSEEIARYLFIWTTYLGLSFAIREREHIVTDVLPRRLPPKINQIINIVSTTCFAVFAFLMAYFGYRYSFQMVRFERITEAMHIPMVYFCSSVGIGFALAFFRLLGVLKYEIKVFRNM